MRLLLLALPVAFAAGLASDSGREGPASLDRGLPREGADWRPYHRERDHPLNLVARRILLVETVPAKVGADLPREPLTSDPLPADWMLRWRDGAPPDRRLFGGDGRQLPREGFDEDESRALRNELAAITDEDASELKTDAILAVLFQHDLLRMAVRLVDSERNPELISLLMEASQRVALPRELLVALEPLSYGDALAPREGEWKEVLRRSTRLFDASRTLLWSRAYLSHPDGAESLLRSIESSGDDVEVPVGMRALLEQGIVAIDSDGEPCATSLVVDVRAQVLANRDPRGADNATTSRDGVDFSILHLERESVRRRDDAGVRVFRDVDDEDQDLFRDYGTLKHTTYRAQCALCHRITRHPEPQLGGFPILRPSARPRFAETGAERMRLAEDQVREKLVELRRD
ncbi:MAG: hypothetical protein AAF726_03635 [Planctomycetota bacterium]